MASTCEDTTGLKYGTVVKAKEVTNAQCGRSPTTGIAKSYRHVKSVCSLTDTAACNFCTPNTAESSQSSPDVETCCKDCALQVGCADGALAQKAAECVIPPVGYANDFRGLLKCVTPKEGYMVDKYGIVYEARCGAIPSSELVKRGLVEFKDQFPVETTASAADPKTGFIGSCDDQVMFSGQKSSCEVKCSQFSEEAYDVKGV